MLPLVVASSGRKQLNMKKTVLFVAGGISGEHEISLISAKHVLKHLDRNQYNCLVLVISKSGEMSLFAEDKLASLSDNPKQVKTPKGQLVDFRPYAVGNMGPCFVSKEKSFSFDMVFPLLHGVGGEDGRIQGFFETAKVPLVGTKTAGSSICIDKALTKRLCMQRELPVVPFQEVSAPISAKELLFDFPVFVKPALEGSSLGVSKASNEAEFLEGLREARRFGAKILIEPAITGRELGIAVLDDGNERVMSPAGEIVCESAAFYSYDAKYVDSEAAKLIAPAELSPSELLSLQKIASNVFDAVECRGLARIDFFMTKDGKFLLNEVNTLPGFTPISMYPRLMGLAGVSYSDLISRLLHSAA